MNLKQTDMENWFMKTPCKHCPFRRDVKPFLTTERAEQLAYGAQNPYNSFACHKTTVEVEEYNEDGELEETLGYGEGTKECAGFMALQHFENCNDLPDGFEPSEEVYSDAWEMIDAYEEHNSK